MKRFRDAKNLDEEVKRLLHYCKNNPTTMAAISRLQKNAYDHCLAATSQAPCSLKYFFKDIDMKLSLALLECHEEIITHYTYEALWGVLYAIMAEAGNAVQQELLRGHQRIAIKTNMVEDGIEFSLTPSRSAPFSMLEDLLGSDAF